MSVGKSSIKRAASAGTAKTEAEGKPVKVSEEAAGAAKPTAKTAAKTTAKPAAKTAAKSSAKTTKTTAKTPAKTASKAASKVVEAAVVTPIDSEELQAKFISGKPLGGQENSNRPVRLTEEMPIHLL